MTTKQTKKPAMFFCIIPHAWGTGPTLASARKRAFREGGYVYERGTTKACLVVEYPEGTEISVSEIDGAWHASKPAVRIAQQINFKGTYSLDENGRLKFTRNETNTTK